MADRGELFHSSNLGSVTSGWERLGENVGVGPDNVSALHTAFMNSAAHRNNILGDFNYVGVGVTIDAAGFMWVTVIFMKAAAGLNGGETTTTTPTPATTTTAPPTTTTTQLPNDPSDPIPTTTTTLPPPSDGEPPAGDQPEVAEGSTEAADAYNELVSLYPRFGLPSPPAIMD
jgi:hypothetical protein